MTKALEDRYLSYALSTITARSLPDVRDGLKPVHRRILWAMKELGLHSRLQPKKSARVVGDVIGKYHPHGDASVYDAMVRMAQDFSLRYPLVDGQGNFGNIDGDSAAAMRYTESRLTAMGEHLMEGLEENAVDFRPTYDGTEEEPFVMPSAFPNLLANGSTGIAVGMATSVPPHNLAELCDALLFLLKERPKQKLARKDLHEKLMTKIQGPDFPTGGTLVETRESMLSSYRTGRGSFRLRAKWEKEDLGKGMWQVVITQIPFTVRKSNLIEKLAESLDEKKFPEVEDVRDESDERVRVVVLPKSRTTDVDIMMERLFRYSDLEIKFPLNLNVLGSDRAPRVMSLQESLEAFLDHRREVMLRRAVARLEKIIHRLEIIEGLRITYLNLDEVIAVIRSADEPKQELMSRFSLTELQADYILDTRLRSLRRIEETALLKEREELLKEKQDLEELLAQEPKQDARLAEQIKALVAAGSKDIDIWPRRTVVADAPVIDLTDPQDDLPADPLTVICSKAGWIRSVKGHVEDASGLTFKEGDGLDLLLHAHTNEKIMVLMSDGRAYAVPAAKLPSGRGAGEPLRHLFEIPPGSEIVDILTHEEDALYLLVSSDGYGFRIRSQNMVASKKAGRLIMPCNPGAHIRALLPVQEGQDMVALTTSKDRLLLFPLEEIPEMERARGVVLDKGGAFTDIMMFDKKDGLYTVDAAGRRRGIEDWKRWVGHRAQAGMMPPKGFPKSMKFGV